jgi:hypothetical protein
MSDYNFTFAGLVVGPGTDFHVYQVEGLGTHDVDLINLPLPRWHGSFAADSFMRQREVVITVDAEGDDQAAVNAALDELYAAWGTPTPAGEDVLSWQLPGQAVRRLGARVHSVSEPRPVDAETDLQLERRVDFRFRAADPVVYADTEDVAEVMVFAASAGLSYPVAYPKVYGAGGSGAGTVVANAGRFLTWPRLEVVGPSSGTLSDPELENVTTGKAIRLSANGGAQVGVGQTLVVEAHPLRRSIAFTTGASRYGKLSVGSEFWALEPGDNELRFRAGGSTAGALMRVRSRSAWLRG